MQFWEQEPSFFMPLKPLVSGEELFNEQMEKLANAILIEDFVPNMKIDTCLVTADTRWVFPKDAVLSGSFVMHYVNKKISGNTNVKYDDIDIYFKLKEDAIEFFKMNGITTIISDFDFSNPMCAYGELFGQKFNLIYGVPYETPSDLISSFDIRACSMALDINTKILYAVNGSIQDTLNKRIVFNPVPRNVSIRRVIKYNKKDFNICPHQAVFFAELIKAKRYSPELELLTKQY